MTLRKIKLELARCPQFPEGNPAHGYEFTAPLDGAGNFDAHEWQKHRAQCTVRRFADGPDERGLLIHTRGKRWAFSYDPATSEDDEPIFKFDRHVFKTGEYVSITEHDGIQRTFRVAAAQ